MQKIFISLLSIILFIMVLSIAVVGIDNNILSDGKNNDVIKQVGSNNKIKTSYSKEELSIDVYITKEDRVETMDLEEYVLGVVAAEMPAEFELEALKAQAVAARTYGLAHTDTFKGEKNEKLYGADLDDTTAFQVFMNKEQRMDAWPKNKREGYWKKLNKAVSETEGEVLTYNGELVMAPYYFSTSSGKTENGIDVFGIDVPYLKSVKSIGEEDAPKYKSEFVYTYNELTEALNKWNSKLNLKPSTLKENLTILERTQGGSVSKIKVGKESISGKQFRSILNLNSANFNIEFNNKNVTIICHGYGHGVGMSQWGADAMAEDGYNYKEILKHYYQGTDIKKIKTK